jgi:rhomboid protease GluP
MRCATSPGFFMSSSASVQPKSDSAGEADSYKPWLTYAILLTLAGVYVSELVYAVNPSRDLAPSVQTLVALGGLNKTILLSRHEWYRICTAPFLHGGLLHLLSNGIALFFAGGFLERQLGRFWYFSIFALGACGGACLSLAANPPDVTSVGASGAIMTLFVILFIGSFRLQDGPQRKRVQVESLRILIPSLLSIVAPSGMHIDINAHLGGALTGVVLGLLLLKFWPQNLPAPPYQRFAECVAMLSAAVFIASFALAADHYPAYVKSLALLIPEKSLPKNDDAVRNQSAELVRRYPHDPRAYIFHADALLMDHNPISARYELEAGLKEADTYRFLYGLRLSNTMRIMLAAIWIDNGAPYEAEKVIGPVCRSSSMDRPDEKTYQFVVEHKLCIDNQPH